MESDHAWCQFPLLPGGFQTVPGQNVDAVKEAVRHGIGLGQVERDPVAIEFADGDGPTLQHEQVALRGVNFLIQHHLECEHHIVGVERVSVGEFKVLAQFQDPVQAVGRALPGFGQRGLGLQGLAVDVNQVRHQALQNLAGTGVSGKQPVERFGFGSLRGNQAAAAGSHGSGKCQAVVGQGMGQPHRSGPKQRRT